MGAVDSNWVAALTVRASLLLVPRTVLPKALKVLPAVTVTAASEVMGAVLAKVVTALTVRVWLPVAPSTTLELAVMGAVEANVVAAFTIST